MPSTLHTESQQLRDERVRQRPLKAREYWLKCPSYLAEEDLCQTGEKGWGAFAQMAKTVAGHRGWRHFRRGELLAAARQIADEPADTMTIREAIEIARTMHANFDEGDLDRISIEIGLARVESLLPERYAGGLSFFGWLAEADPQG